MPEGGNGRGQADLFRGPGQAVRTPDSRDNARLDQRLGDLLDEEGVATRALLDALGESVERRVGAEQVGQQLLDRLWAERQERKLLVIGPLHPLRVVLGAEVKEQQTAVPGCGVDHVLEECLARAV